MALTVPKEPTLKDIDGMGYAVPLPDKPSAWFERGAPGLNLFIYRSGKLLRKALWQFPELSRLDFKGEEPTQEPTA